MAAKKRTAPEDKVSLTPVTGELAKKLRLLASEADCKVSLVVRAALAYFLTSPKARQILGEAKFRRRIESLEEKKAAIEAELRKLKS